MIVAGIGFRRGCSSDKILGILRAALSLARLPQEALTLIAIPEFKAGEVGPGTAARTLKVELRAIDSDAIGVAQAACVIRSETVNRKTGFHSVAEGAALAAAGPGSRLILARIDNGSATCALAESEAR